MIKPAQLAFRPGLRFWLGLAITRRDSGLAASPSVRYILEVGVVLFFRLKATQTSSITLWVGRIISAGPSTKRRDAASSYRYNGRAPAVTAAGFGSVPYDVGTESLIRSARTLPVERA